MLPGFIDSHSHFVQTAIKLSTVNLDPPPAGSVTSIDEIVAVLAAELEENPRMAGEWLYGWGYDNASLKERRHPTRTAYLREPYYRQAEGAALDYRGYSSIRKQEHIDQLVAGFYELVVPIYIHALGDAAVDQAIHSVGSAEAKFPRDDIRTQLIHLQLLHEDQMEALKRLDATLTFQITHNFHFADFHHEQTFGPERTAKLNPMKSALDRGLSVTFHHDSPVHPVNQMDLIWIATHRSSRSGRVYGPEERLTPYQALRASTLESAWQFFEEDRKGSLVIGKLADLVILFANPLKVDLEKIKDIQILETIKEGQSIFRRVSSAASL